MARSQQRDMSLYKVSARMATCNSFKHHCISQSREMQIQSQTSRVSRSGNLTWRSGYGFCQTWWIMTMTYSHHSEASAKLSKIGQFLSMIYTKLLSCCQASYRAYPEKTEIYMDPRMSTGIWHPQAVIPRSIHSLNSRPIWTIPDQMWHFEGRHRSSSMTKRIWWPMAPMFPPVQDLLGNWIELPNLWLETPCNH